MVKSVRLRKFPYPFRAALAICSDIDATSSSKEFLEIQKFLCTKEMTSMGPGVGLEIGNSFYMYSALGTFGYFTGQNIDQIGNVDGDIIADFVRAGYIDCLHTFGDIDIEEPEQVRSMAEHSVREMEAQNMKVDIWTNHGHWFRHCRYQNIGPSRDCLGDKQDSVAYHLDITFAYGIRFHWIYMTGFIGQDVPLWPWRITELFYGGDFLSSVVELGKTILRFLRGLVGSKLYRGDLTNKLTKVIELSDGRKLYGFKRFNCGPRGRNSRADSKALATQISPDVLKTLKKNGGYLIVYTHLGKNTDCSDVIAEESQQALRNLAEEHENGEIYVTTTSRLLNYNVIHRYLNWECSAISHNEVKITIRNVLDPIRGNYLPDSDQLQGITFYVPNHMEARVFIGQQEISNIKKCPVDYTGKRSVMFPRNLLQYPSKYL